MMTCRNQHKGMIHNYNDIIDFELETLLVDFHKPYLFKIGVMDSRITLRSGCFH